jgi:hypothetical protein
MQARFQHTLRPSLYSIYAKHRDMGRTLPSIALLFVLYLKDVENAWLELDPAEDTGAMPQILVSSLCYRLAIDRHLSMLCPLRPTD